MSDYVIILLLYCPFHVLVTCEKEEEGYWLCIGPVVHDC